MAFSNTPDTTPPGPNVFESSGNDIINNPPSPDFSGDPGNYPTGAVGPGDSRIIELVLSDKSWPNDLILEHEKYNWPEWYRRMTILVYKQGFSPWLDGSLECPDEQRCPGAYWIWQENECSLRSFLLKHISPLDFTLVRNLPSSHEIFEALRKRHERLAPFAQVALLNEALNVKFTPGTPFSETKAQLEELNRRILAMGKLEGDRLLTVLLLRSLGFHFSHLLSTLQTMATELDDFSSKTILKCIEGEAFLIQCRAEQGLRPFSVNPTAFATVNARQPKPPCSNCKRSNHLTEFCISPGGKMAGRTFDDARAAQRAASGNAPRTSKR